MGEIQAGDIVTLKGHFVPLTHQGCYFLVMKIAEDAGTKFFHVFDHLRGVELWYTHLEVERVEEDK